jgi:long-chain acyl-CoA synthetase
LSSGECDHFFYDKLIFDKIKEIVGGKVRTMISGGDHMDPDVQNFMRVVFGVPLLMTYGLTESTQGSFITDAIDPTSGHVGGPTVIVIVK